jgi:hypothetical protein
MPQQRIKFGMKDSFYEELQRVFVKFLKYHTKILLEDFNAKVSREDIFKPIGIRVHAKLVKIMELLVE